jgi:(1->4)-alpha-D-glucan 1-alpha-D-glucosylmutase
MVDVGSAPVVDVLTGRRHPGGALRLVEALEHYPVALLAEEGGIA